MLLPWWFYAIIILKVSCSCLEVLREIFSRWLWLLMLVGPNVTYSSSSDPLSVERKNFIRFCRQVCVNVRKNAWKVSLLNTKLLLNIQFLIVWCRNHFYTNLTIEKYQICSNRCAVNSCFNDTYLLRRSEAIRWTVSSSLGSASCPLVNEPRDTTSWPTPPR